ncbi:inositol monophosphatase family protein [Oceaniglobus ichthyenteri]|uniref:inositol monophosphatase family protein n=1 Tax=Oceaniglobus ichthyenteri TaxID=2136177 RepID=UPI001F0B8AF5|nr:inositol monophosphatase family protein [Oceaniglobus ichthyenteri]
MSGPAHMRLLAARAIAAEAGALALEYFRDLDTLTVDHKGHQDLVSQADREVETLIRTRITQAFPADAIKGEEQADTPGSSRFTWVIDPIDGTANFVRGIPAWCVVLAVVSGPDTVVGVIHDPVHGETCHAEQGGGAFCNHAPIKVAQDATLSHGAVGLGLSGRSDRALTIRTIDDIMARGGLFYRNASGALSLSYVARGRLLGYIEQHMNPWDCLAGQLLVAEAGGMTEPQDAQVMLAQGGRVVVAAPGVWRDLCDIAVAFGPPAITQD